MEQSVYLDATLELYARARKTHRNVGVCVQAYFHRTEKDVDGARSDGGVRAAGERRVQ